MATFSLEDIEFCEEDDKNLGEGGFSQVKLVRNKKTAKLYALKIVNAA